MSTRSLIGKVLDDSGKVKVIYCHSDGYINEPGVGYYLKTFYKNEKDVDKLLDLGDLSYLGEIPEDDPELWKIGSTNSGKCRTYRGRGDTDVEARIYKNPRTAISEEGQSYHYFYIDGKWYCIEGNNPGFIDLETGEFYDKENNLGEKLNMLEKKDSSLRYYTLLIGDGKGIASRRTIPETLYTFHTKANNIEEAINNLEKDIRNIDEFDSFDEQKKDNNDLSYYEYFDSKDPGDGDIWLIAYIEDDRLIDKGSLDSIRNGEEGEFIFAEDCAEDAESFDLDTHIEDGSDEMLAKLVKKYNIDLDDKSDDEEEIFVDDDVAEDKPEPTTPLEEDAENNFDQLAIGDHVVIRDVGEESPWEGLSGTVSWINDEEAGDEFQTITVRVNFPTADGDRAVEQNFDRRNVFKE